MDGCIGLDDDRALDPEVAGGKAARLARAARAGLPVLPGVVLPVAAGRHLVEAALEAIRLRGPAHARVAIAGTALHPDLVDELQRATVRLGRPLVARSSSPFEDDGTWSGAFGSIHGVMTDDLATAVRACLGSAFSMDALERGEQVGIPVERMGIAVLLQPEVDPEVGGTARVRPDGSVVLSATHGPMRALMEGWVEGATSTVGPDDDVTIGAGDETLEPTAAVATAAVARATRRALGDALIEWALVDGRVLLLQSMPSPDRDGTTAAPAATERAELDDPVAKRVAVAARRRVGRLGEELVLPWAVAADVWPRDVGVVEIDPAEAWARAQALARELVAAAWSDTPHRAEAEAERTLRRVRAADDGALECLRGLRPPPPERVRELLGLLDVVERHMVGTGLLPDAESMWRLSSSEVDRVLRGGVAVVSPPRSGVDRWEPFVHGVVMAQGTRSTGHGLVPGAGAGRVHVVGDVWSDEPPRGRCVLVASRPLPALSPLLWDAAGLVIAAGNRGAHLLEFARSIGVPTVVGCPIGGLRTGLLAAVDGGTGTLASIDLETTVRTAA